VGVLEPPTTTLASVGRRFAARLLDGVVLLPIWLVLVLSFGGSPASDGAFQIPDTALRVFWVVGAAYEIGLIALTGQTLGKRWMGIRVVDATTGAVPNLDQAGRRAAPTLLGIVPFLGTLAPLLYVPALWQPRRQGLHDSLAATVVVRDQPLAPS
jgi:uncharacterized RDD family membrane protein YckC